MHTRACVRAPTLLAHPYAATACRCTMHTHTCTHTHVHIRACTDMLSAHIYTHTHSRTCTDCKHTHTHTLTACTHTLTHPLTAARAILTLRTRTLTRVLTVHAPCAAHTHAFTVRTHAPAHVHTHACACPALAGATERPPQVVHTRARLPWPGSPLPAPWQHPPCQGTPPRVPIACPGHARPQACGHGGSNAGFGGTQQIALPWQRGTVD